MIPRFGVEQPVMITMGYNGTIEDSGYHGDVGRFSRDIIDLDKELAI